VTIAQILLRGIAVLLVAGSVMAGIEWLQKLTTTPTPTPTPMDYSALSNYCGDMAHISISLEFEEAFPGSRQQFMASCIAAHEPIPPAVPWTR
jgi:hypothetical protein